MAGLGVIGITEATWQMIAQSQLMAYDEYSKMVGTIGAWVRHVPPQHHQRTREYLTGAAACATLTKMMYELVNTTHPDKQKADLKRVALWFVQISLAVSVQGIGGENIYVDSFQRNDKHIQCVIGLYVCIMLFCSRDKFLF